MGKLGTFLIYFFCLCAACFGESTAVAAIDAGTLNPPATVISAGSVQRISFSATHDQPGVLKDYAITFKWGSGLRAANLSASPLPVKAEISSRGNSIQLLWENIPASTVLSAGFDVSGAVGTYTIAASSIIYHDSTGRRRAGTCNEAAVSVRADLSAPDMPRNLISSQTVAGVSLGWSRNIEADLSYYEIERSEDGLSFRSIGTTSSPQFFDTMAQPGKSYLYKVRAIDVSGNASAPAVTAETFLGAGQKQIDAMVASQAAVGDLDGDGLVDLAIGLPNGSIGKGRNAVIGGRVDLYLGKSATGTPDIMLAGETYDDQFGTSLVMVDMDNDGYDDLIVGAPHYDPYLTWPVIGNAPDAGRVYVYRGGPAFSTLPVATLTGKWSARSGGGVGGSLWQEQLGFSMALAGDVNGDGYQDIAIGAPYGGMEFSGSVTILYGGLNLASLARQEIKGPVWYEHMGSSVSLAGDVNGDGFDDLVTGAPDEETYRTAGNVYVILGGRDPGMTGGPLNIGTAGFGSSVAGMDLNGDGYGDIAATSNTSGYLFFGSENGYAQTPLKLSSTRTAVLSPGDLNQDCYDELLLDGPVVYFGNSLGEMIPEIDSSGIRLIGAGSADSIAAGYLVLADATQVYVHDISFLFGLPEIVFQSPLVNGPLYQKELTIAGRVSVPVRQLFVAGIEHPVDANGAFTAVYSLQPLENTIEVIAVSTVGKITKRTLKISFVALPPLTIAITTPLDGQVFHAPALKVSGTVSDASAQVMVNNVPAVVNGNTFQADIVLQEWANTITAEALDRYNRTESHVIHITLRSLGSMGGRITDAATGRGVEGVLIDLRNGIETRIGMSGADGSYAFGGLPEGIYSISLNRSGYLSQTIVRPLAAGESLVLDVAMTAIPRLDLNITYPQDNAELHDPTLILTGTVSHPANVTVNGMPVSVNDTMFSGSLELSEGQNPLAVVAYDQYGQSITCQLTVFLVTTGNLSGTVIDARTSVPLAGAQLAITDAHGVQLTGETGLDGKYEFSGLLAGQIVGRIVQAGYHALVFEETILAGGNTNRTDRLNPIFPTINEIMVSQLAPDSTVVTWSTDMPADSRIEYGLDETYTSILETSSLSLNHSIKLQGLTAGTAYHYRVVSRNEFGFVAASDDLTFMTPVFTAEWIGDYGNIAVMEVRGDYSANSPNGSIDSVPREEIAKEFYRNHPDNHDFLVVFSGFDFPMPDTETRAYYLSIKNDTLGISKPVFDSSAFYGSSGKLQGMIDMGNAAQIGQSVHDQKFEETLVSLSHEFAHRWVTGVKFRDEGGSTSSALLGKDGRHWSFLLDTDGSVLYGNDWKDNKDGTFTSTGGKQYYSRLDLYLMGMLDKTKIKPMTLIDNPGVDPTQLPQVGAVVSGMPKTVTIEDIVAVEGERVPDALSAQKSFRIGYVYIVRPGTFDGTGLEAIEEIRRAFAGRLGALTQGQGKIEDMAAEIAISIASPLDGAVVSGNDVLVEGVVINTTGAETGVTVNGVPTAVYNNRFVANNVSLGEGANTLTITATDESGNTATKTLTVNAVTTGHSIRLVSNIESGALPLEVMVRVDGTFSITQSTLSVSGPVQPEVSTISPEEYQLKFPAEGVYYVTVGAIEPDDIIYQDTVAITVLNKNQIDALLQIKWMLMKSKLANQDTNGALSYHTAESKDIYAGIYIALLDELPLLHNEMNNVQLIYVKNNTAKYRLRELEDYGGAQETVTYYIYFVLDSDGVWKIYRY